MVRRMESGNTGVMRKCCYSGQFFDYAKDDDPLTYHPISFGNFYARDSKGDEEGEKEGGVGMTMFLLPHHFLGNRKRRVFQFLPSCTEELRMLTK